MIRKYIPDAITSLNLLSGAVAIVFAFKGRIDIAFPLMLLSAVFDFCDGLAARALGAYSDGAQFFIMKDFFGALTGISASMTMGDAYPKTVLSVATMLVGLFVIIFLARKKVTASVILGMFAASVIYWIGDFVILQENPFAAFSDASWIPAFGDMANLTFCKFNFEALAQIGWLTVITLLITFVMIDM